MRIAVVGGTGLVGRHTVRAVGDAEHDAVVVARSRGGDVATGAVMDDALIGVDPVTDVTNTANRDAEAR